MALKRTNVGAVVLPGHVKREWAGVPYGGGFGFELKSHDILLIPNKEITNVVAIYKTPELCQGADEDFL